MLLVLIPTVWLAIAVVILAACQMAAQADAAEPYVPSPVGPRTLPKVRLTRQRFRADRLPVSASGAVSIMRSRDHIGPFAGPRSRR
jgi:hypothetical protein